MFKRISAAFVMLVSASGGVSALPPMEAIQVKQARGNGVDLAYVDEGRGETVVLTHGASGDWRTWYGVGAFAGNVALRHPELLRSVLLGARLRIRKFVDCEVGS
jgi:pimeloyl-ACP methyl ester carboxylesterase